MPKKPASFGSSFGLPLSFADLTFLIVGEADLRNSEFLYNDYYNSFGIMVTKQHAYSPNYINQFEQTQFVVVLSRKGREMGGRKGHLERRQAD